MLSPVHRRPNSTAIVAAIGVAFAISACNTSRHQHDAPIAHTIVVPAPQQVTGTIDTSRMDWLSRFLSTADGTARR